MPRRQASYRSMLLGACLLFAGLPLQGCLAPGGWKSDSRSTGAERTADAKWLTTQEALGVAETGREIDTQSPQLRFSHNPDELRQQLRSYCADWKKPGDAALLGGVVARLYTAGIDPAVCAEALIKADCGSLAEVVREMVSQGGAPAVAPVVDRALFLAGSGAEGLIESAASAGLREDIEGQTGGGGRDSTSHSVRFAMAYFPAGGRGGVVATAADGSTLYSAATPGYGIYSFIVLGEGFEDLVGKDVERYRELLRVIETYVLSTEVGTRGPDQDTHTFLIPVDPDRDGRALFQQMGPGLSARMRLALADYLALSDRVDLARRLETGAGPFLVSSLQPRLVPAGRGELASRLFVDLSDKGPEFMYAIVDAYDRPIPDDIWGTSKSFDPIRVRLQGLFGTSGRLTGKGDWVYLLRPGTRMVRAAPGTSENRLPEFESEAAEQM